MNEPNEDPIEKMIKDLDRDYDLHHSIVNAIPAIRALQERCKRLQKERLKESEHTNNYINFLHKAEAKLARVIEIGDGMARSLTTEYGSNLTCVENWRKAVEE